VKVNQTGIVDSERAVCLFFSESCHGSLEFPCNKGHKQACSLLFVLFWNMMDCVVCACFCGVADEKHI